MSMRTSGNKSPSKSARRNSAAAAAAASTSSSSSSSASSTCSSSASPSTGSAKQSPSGKRTKKIKNRNKSQSTSGPFTKHTSKSIRAPDSSDSIRQRSSTNSIKQRSPSMSKIKKKSSQRSGLHKTSTTDTIRNIRSLKDRISENFAPNRKHRAKIKLKDVFKSFSSSSRASASSGGAVFEVRQFKHIDSTVELLSLGNQKKNPDEMDRAQTELFVPGKNQFEEANS